MIRNKIKKVEKSDLIPTKVLEDYKIDIKTIRDIEVKRICETLEAETTRNKKNLSEQFKNFSIEEIENLYLPFLQPCNR